jgi:hypothetical protein
MNILNVPLYIADFYPSVSIFSVTAICPLLKCKACLPRFGYVKDARGCQTCKCARKLNNSAKSSSFKDVIMTNPCLPMFTKLSHVVFQVSISTPSGVTLIG